MIKDCRFWNVENMLHIINCQKSLIESIQRRSDEAEKIHVSEWASRWIDRFLSMNPPFSI